MLPYLPQDKLLYEMWQEASHFVEAWTKKTSPQSSKQFTHL